MVQTKLFSDLYLTKFSDLYLAKVSDLYLVKFSDLYLANLLDFQRNHSCSNNFLPNNFKIIFSGILFQTLSSDWTNTYIFTPFYS